jgi:hypothetical protein
VPALAARAVNGVVVYILAAISFYDQLIALLIARHGVSGAACCVFNEYVFQFNRHSFITPVLPTPNAQRRQDYSPRYKRHYKYLHWCHYRPRQAHQHHPS